MTEPLPPEAYARVGMPHSPPRAGFSAITRTLLHSDTL